MKIFLTLIICVFLPGCKESQPESPSIHLAAPIVTDDSLFDYTHEDSLQMDRVNRMYQHIGIAKRWLNAADSNSYVSIRKNDLDISIIYELSDSGGVVDVIDLVNHRDSLVFWVSGGRIWVFDKQKQEWLVTTTQTGQRTNLGRYLQGSGNK